MTKFLPAFLLSLTFTLLSFAAPVPAPHSTSEVLSSHQTIVPGQTFTIAWQIKADEGWHTYWQNPGDSGLANTLHLNLPEGWQAGELQFPTPEKIVFEPIVTYGYHDTVTMLTTVTVPADWPEGSITLQPEAEYLICRDICLPAGASHELTLRVATEAVVNPSAIPLIETAQQAHPQPYEGELAATAADGELRLALPAVLQQASLFIPAKEGVINDLDDQRLENGELSVELDSTLRALPDRLAGVLVVGSESYTVNFTIDGSLAAPVPNVIPETDKTDPSLNIWWALAAAFLAGLILNLMPCVLPVLSLKALSLVKLAHGGQALAHSAAYIAGIMLTFWLFAGGILILQQLGQAVGWGFHLQEPSFVLALVVLLTLLSLNLLGVFEWGNSLTNVGSKKQSSGVRGSFWGGVLITVVATPCTVPFMGTAVGFALGQSTPLLFTTFGLMALGLGTPFVVLALLPAARKWLPKPGAWLTPFKQFLAFPLLATVVWLLWVYQGQQAGTLLAVLSGLLMLSFMAWIFGLLNQPHRSKLMREIAWLALLVGIASSIMLPQWFPAKAPAATTAEMSSNVWSPAAVQAAQAQGKAVFVYFTADWCITCKVNERLTLKHNSVKAAFAANNVTVLVGDWTNRNPEITAELKRHGRVGVPLYLYYPPNASQPKVLPQLLTPQLVVEALAT